MNFRLFFLSGILFSFLPTKAWQFALCNDTNEAVGVSGRFPLCGLATEPRIDYLAPYTCAIIDNSGTWYAGCAISSVSFNSVNGKTPLKTVSGRHWWDYTFTLTSTAHHGFDVTTTRGTVVPETCRTVAVLQNMSLLVMGRIFKSLDQEVASGNLKPQDLQRAVDKATQGAPSLRAPKGDVEGGAALVIGGAIIGTAVVAGLGFLTYDLYKALSSCYRNGKYLVYLTPQDTVNPAKAAQLVENNQCGDACIPNPHTLAVAPETVCGFEVVPDLRKKFSYVKR